MEPVISIIVPHNNIPDLLKRCIDSIPQIDGVEVIIVDDNSNPQIVDFNHFPGADRQDTTIVLDKSGTGAGHARNIGIQNARGKWLAFADADDFFEVGGVEMMMEYQHSTEDIIFFNCRGVLSENITKEFPRRGRDMYFSLYKKNNDDLPFRIDWPEPWGKMVKRELVETYGFRFSEVKWGNDVFFQVKIGSQAKAVKIIDKTLYVATLRSGSLCSKLLEGKRPSSEQLRVRLNEAAKVQEYLQSKGMPDHKQYQKRAWLFFRYYPMLFIPYFVKLLFTDWHKATLFINIAYIKVKTR